MRWRFSHIIRYEVVLARIERQRAGGNAMELGVSPTSFGIIWAAFPIPSAFGFDAIYNAAV